MCVYGIAGPCSSLAIHSIVHAERKQENFFAYVCSYFCSQVSILFFFFVSLELQTYEAECILGQISCFLLPEIEIEPQIFNFHLF